MIVEDFEEKRGVSGGMDERVGMERHVPGGDVGRHWVAVVIVDRYENDFTAHSLLVEEKAITYYLYLHFLAYFMVETDPSET